MESLSSISIYSGCSQITCIDAGPLQPSLRAGGLNGSADVRMGYPGDLNSPRPQLYLQLQYLDLTDCVGLGDAGVQMIVRSCAQLTCLYLRRLVHVTGAS